MAGVWAVSGEQVARGSGGCEPGALAGARAGLARRGGGVDLDSLGRRAGVLGASGARGAGETSGRLTGHSRRLRGRLEEPREGALNRGADEALPADDRDGDRPGEGCDQGVAHSGNGGEGQGRPDALLQGRTQKAPTRWRE